MVARPFALILLASVASGGGAPSPTSAGRDCERDVVRLQQQLEAQGQLLEKMEQRILSLESAGTAGKALGELPTPRGDFGFSVRLEHFGRILARVADPRLAAQLMVSGPASGARPLLSSEAMAICPPASFPLETKSNPPYKVCVRHHPDSLEAMLSVFGKWEDAEFVRGVASLVLNGVPQTEHIVIVDVGANIGAVTLYLGSMLREAGYNNVRILALEPEPESAALLRAGVQLNALEDAVEVVEAAASTASGQVDFARFRAEVSRSSLMPSFAEGKDAREFAGLQGNHAHQLPYERLRVAAVTLQSLLAKEQRIHVLKLDVEAHEVHALLGLGADLLKRVSAVVFEFRAWGLEQVVGKPELLLEMLANAGLVILCPSPCRSELEAVLRSGERRPAYLDGEPVYPEDFPRFVELSMRLKTQGRDFDTLAIRSEMLAQR